MTDVSIPPCEVCGAAGIGVASSGIGAISFSFCKECAHKPAEPLWIFAYLFEDVGTNGEGLRPEVDSYWTWEGGRYVSWPEYRDGRRAGLGLPPLGDGQPPPSMLPPS